MKNAITQHTSDPQAFDQNKLLAHVSDLFGKHPANGTAANPKPASQDPYGDPADQRGGGGNVKPASQDPYGDPADQRR